MRGLWGWEEERLWLCQHALQLASSVILQDSCHAGEGQGWFPAGPRFQQ
jgi:hypothetical protein